MTSSACASVISSPPFRARLPVSLSSLMIGWMGYRYKYRVRTSTSENCELACKNFQDPRKRALNRFHSRERFKWPFWFFKWTLKLNSRTSAKGRTRSFTNDAVRPKTDDHEFGLNGRSIVKAVIQRPPVIVNHRPQEQLFVNRVMWNLSPQSWNRSFYFFDNYDENQ